MRNRLAQERHVNDLLGRRVADDDEPLSIDNDEGIRKDLRDGCQKMQGIGADRSSALRRLARRVVILAIERPNHGSHQSCVSRCRLAMDKGLI